MWIWKVMRIIFVSLIGAAIIFLVQPWLYQNGVIPLNDVEPKAWVSSDYTNSAVTVFAVSVLSVILWYLIASKAKIKSASDVSRTSVIWWLIFLLPILSICGYLYFFNKSGDALLSLTTFFVLDILLLFWLSTAISSPRYLMFAVPGSFFLRRLFGSWTAHLVPELTDASQMGISKFQKAAPWFSKFFRPEQGMISKMFIGDQQNLPKFAEEEQQNLNIINAGCKSYLRWLNSLHLAEDSIELFNKIALSDNNGQLKSDKFSQLLFDDNRDKDKRFQDTVQRLKEELINYKNVNTGIGLAKALYMLCKL